MIQGIEDFCSSNCYKHLIKKKGEYEKLRKNRKAITSALNRSLIKLGIQMNSYDPCFIRMILLQN